MMPANGASLGAVRGSSASTRSRVGTPLRRLRRCSHSSLSAAMSTPVGHSRLHPLHDTQSDIASAISAESRPSFPSWPVMASRSALARPRVEWRSSPVAR